MFLGKGQQVCQPKFYIAKLTYNQTTKLNIYSDGPDPKFTIIEGFLFVYNGVVLKFYFNFGLSGTADGFLPYYFTPSRKQKAEICPTNCPK